MLGSNVYRFLSAGKTLFDGDCDESVLRTWSMECYRQMFLKQREIPVCREYRDILAYPYGADKEVSV
jgi:hypothetical protein